MTAGVARGSAKSVGEPRGEPAAWCGLAAVALDVPWWRRRCGHRISPRPLVLDRPDVGAALGSGPSHRGVGSNRPVAVCDRIQAARWAVASPVGPRTSCKGADPHGRFCPSLLHLRQLGPVPAHHPQREPSRRSSRRSAVLVLPAAACRTDPPRRKQDGCRGDRVGCPVGAGDHPVAFPVQDPAPTRLSFKLGGFLRRRPAPSPELPARHHRPAGLSARLTVREGEDRGSSTGQAWAIRSAAVLLVAAQSRKPSRAASVAHAAGSPSRVCASSRSPRPRTATAPR